MSERKLISNRTSLNLDDSISVADLLKFLGQFSPRARVESTPSYDWGGSYDGRLYFVEGASAERRRLEHKYFKEFARCV